MKTLLLSILFSGFWCHSWAGPNDPAFAIGNPIPYASQTEAIVKAALPSARLLFISTFAQSVWDPKCSQFGWQFIYQDDSTTQSIRRSFRQISQPDGSCSYVPDSNLDFDKKNYPIPGYVYLDARVTRIRVSFDDAKATAAATVGNGFYPWWANLTTPLHPKGVGRLFWSFAGPVNCNKRASVSIDVETGLVEPAFSSVPTCP